MFKVGDVVELKSGGPKMTIDAVRSDSNYVYATWFQDGIVKRHHFLQSMLKMVSE